MRIRKLMLSTLVSYERCGAKWDKQVDNLDFGWLVLFVCVHCISNWINFNAMMLQRCNTQVYFEVCILYACVCVWIESICAQQMILIVLERNVRLFVLCYLKWCVHRIPSWLILHSGSFSTSNHAVRFGSNIQIVWRALTVRLHSLAQSVSLGAVFISFEKDLISHLNGNQLRLGPMIRWWVTLLRTQYHFQAHCKWNLLNIYIDKSLSISRLLQFASLLIWILPHNSGCACARVLVCVWKPFENVTETEIGASNFYQ